MRDIMSNKLKKKTKPVKDTPIKINISQCMIVKNEEDNIRNALEWAKDIVFEQIVVDTGSVDRTKEIAEQMGARVYDFKWIDDFAAAKNYALDKASGDWIIFTDADEYMSKQSLSNLVQAILNIEYDLRNSRNNNKISVIRTPLINIDDDDSVISKIYQDRVFRNMESLRYHGAIHEHIEMENDKFVFIICDNAGIIHTGYKKSVLARKSERNVGIMEQLYAKNTDNYDVLSYLADSYSMGGKNDKAFEIYRKCMEDIDKIKERSRKYNTYKYYFELLISGYQDVSDFVKKSYEQFVEIMPDMPDVYYYYASYLLVVQKSYDDSIRYFDLCLAKLDKYEVQMYPTIKITSTIDKVHKYLAEAYIYKNNKEQALKSIIIYLRLNKTDEDYLMKLLAILTQEKLPQDELFAAIVNILSGLYDLTDLRDALICVKVAKKLNLNTLSEMLSGRLSQSDRDWLNK